MAKELGVDHITLQTFLGDWGKKDMKSHTAQIRVSQQSDNFVSVLKEAQRVASENQVDLRIYYGQSFSKKKKCDFPRQRPTSHPMEMSYLVVILLIQILLKWEIYLKKIFLKSGTQGNIRIFGTELELIISPIFAKIVTLTENWSSPNREQSYLS